MKGDRLMTALGIIFLTLATLTALIFSVMAGEILAHLVIYRRRGQAAKKKRKRDGNTYDLIDLIKND